MTQNENAVSPVIGVMLMIVVTIIIAAIVSAFAGNTDMAKRSGPVTTLSEETMFSTVPQYAGAWATISTFHAAVHNDAVVQPEQCYDATPGYTVDCTGDDPSCNSYCDSNPDGWDAPVCSGGTLTVDPVDAYCTPAKIIIPALDIAAYTSDSSCGIKLLTNKDGLLVTSEGGDPIDLKDLEFGIRYYDLETVVTGTGVKAQNYKYTLDELESQVETCIASSGATADSTITRGESTAEEWAAANDKRYFRKVGATGTDDTIIRPGDQFMILVDHNQESDIAPRQWALNSVSIDTQSGETEWWLNHKPSGTTLSKGMFKFPNT